MVISSRALVAMGLCTVGLGLLVGPSLGQQPDGGVRRTANNTSTANPATPVPPVIGTIDLDSVFKNYEKVKVSSEEFRAAAMSKKNDLMKIQAEAQQEAEMLAKLTPGTDDFKKHENKVTELKARYEAGREQAERDFAAREAEAMATLYKEIQAMVARVAQWRKMTYVVKVSNQPISGGNPNSVMAAMANTMVYADPRNDITNDVVFNLNRMYKATGGPAPKGSAGAPAAASSTTAPAAGAGAGAGGGAAAAQPDGN
jgi:Skp family chaperone for outer membrane proteins